MQDMQEAEMDDYLGYSRIRLQELGNIIARHEDIEDEKQTVSVPKKKTQT